MTSPHPLLQYNGPIFDAHTHSVDFENLELQVKIGQQFGVVRALLIVHGDTPRPIEQRYPDRFVYAKYLTNLTLFTGDIETVVKEIKKLREKGYQAVKMHFAPLWHDRLRDVRFIPSIDDEMFDVLFGTIKDESLPVLIHIADPDTYYATRYRDSSIYGTKDEHLRQFEERLRRTGDLQVQAAHFGAQPEPHRLENLGRMFEEFQNLNVDTGSARWMVRELGRQSRQSRAFIIKYAHRILFGSDCVSRTDDVSYYQGRYLSERLLFETNIKHTPLPFTDTDTIATGGTFINGLNLPESVLSKLYWENALRFYSLEDI